MALGPPDYRLNKPRAFAGDNPEDVEVTPQWCLGDVGKVDGGPASLVARDGRG